VRVFILGAGGHCKMVLDALRSQAEKACGFFQPKDHVCLDRAPMRSEIMGVAIQEESDENIARLIEQGYEGFVAVGENRLRQKLLRRIKDLGAPIATIISSHAIVSNWAKVGSGSVVMPGAILGADVEVGEGCIINTASSVDHDGYVGNFAHLCPGTRLAGKVKIGEGAFLGTGCSVIPERTIGNWTLLAAGAVVITDIPDSARWAGCPAKPMKTTKQNA